MASLSPQNRFPPPLKNREENLVEKNDSFKIFYANYQSVLPKILPVYTFISRLRQYFITLPNTTYDNFKKRFSNFTMAT